jgi:hypothetical protein
MIGAANQEKLLEERHRQREIGKSTEVKGPRDSRFDDFDDDGFDYDAMMDDDGLEERIPGVNADAEDEDDMDPDNDQENFSGFVFQRSNPASSLASPRTPGMVPTPRDANGKVIGFAMTKDGTADIALASPTLEADPSTLMKPNDDDASEGLGIHNLEPKMEPGPPSIPKSTIPSQDDLYFDEGFADELAFEGDGSTFDESIFDNEDTDQYGRPIPGAFAQAQALRAAQREAAKRGSDSTSRLSAQSAASQSTAHTSFSTALTTAPLVADTQEKQAASSNRESEAAVALPPVSGPDMAYQAALAEAAHIAAASGRFRRGSSPTPPADLTITSPTDSSASQSRPENPLDDYEDDPFANDLDDFDFDDEAIIAEANATALAHDSDGFYGQEFGFYSAPTTQNNNHGRGHNTQNLSLTVPSQALSADNLYQYSNGGYFGPSGGVSRTKSGRILSREPNLTPITERSEYSNRNSIMSLALPQGLGSGGTSSIQSPGLAQLAMMAEDDDISLSALLRLRNKAWGGSQVSLVSSRDGSPKSERGGGRDATVPIAGHARQNSAFSVWSNSDAGSGSGSPTMSMAPLPALSPANMMPAPLFSPPLQHLSTGTVPFPRVPEDDEETPSTPSRPVASPTAQHPKRPGMGHRHKGSADSISYTMEEESGETRWVMERRRTAESGEVEILEREVLGGGAI